jgi:succinyl-CoA synthetase beta subunit
MKIHEYQAKEILARYGIPIVEGKVAESVDDVLRIASELDPPVVVKAQVHVGGRGKAGGVKLAGSLEEAGKVAQQILGMEIKGRPVRKVLVGRAVDIVREFYLGAIVDRSVKSVTLMASAEGGVEIEEVARTAPEKIIRQVADPFLGLLPYQARNIAYGLGLDSDLVRPFVDIALGIYRALRDTDASLVEVNPLAVTPERTWKALDAKIVLDDNGLFRHPDLEALRDVGEEEPQETTARQAGLSFVKLDGDIGCVVNGAGLAMATMDTVKLYGGEPANFLDIGGGAKSDQVTHALRILLSDPKVRVVLFNIFGGITRCDDVARGIVEGLKAVDTRVPIVIRLVGTNEEEGRRILAEAGLIAVTSMSEAAQRAVSLARGEVVAE